MKSRGAATRRHGPRLPALTPLDGLDALSRQDIETMLAVTRALAAPFDLPTMLQTVTDAACRVLHAERGSVWLLDAAAGELVLEVASDLARVRLPLGVGLVGACALERRLVNVPDCYADARFDAEIDRESGFHTRCSLTLPLVDHQGALVGVMQLLNKRDGSFTAADEPLAEALAAQCAVALTRVRMTAALIEGERLQQELELARRVQLRTLPATMPELPGYTMHGSFLPASLTGGDTYDLAHTAQGLLVVLGDATGHGIGPALSVTQLRSMLRMAIRSGHGLEELVAPVNAQLKSDLPGNRFITAWFGQLDADGRGLESLAAGQAPLLHYHAAEARLEVLKADLPPLGMFPVLPPKGPRRVELAPGDLWVVLSDGFYEAEDPAGEQLGVERIGEVLRRCCDRPAGEILAEIRALLERFTQGAPASDDQTAILLRRAG